MGPVFEAHHPHQFVWKLIDLGGIEKELQGESDSLSEMSDMDSLKLQMYMDRQSKIMQAVSNTMKKISNLQETLVQNIK